MGKLGKTVGTLIAGAALLAAGYLLALGVMHAHHLTSQSPSPAYPNGVTTTTRVSAQEILAQQELLRQTCTTALYKTGICSTGPFPTAP